MSSEPEKITTQLVSTAVQICKTRNAYDETSILPLFERAAGLFVIDPKSQEGKRAYHETLRQLHASQVNPLADVHDTLVLSSPEAKQTDAWLQQAKNHHHQLPHWGSYCGYLQEEENADYSQISSLDECTDAILKKCSNPERQSQPVSRKGLVIGEVQAGKTRTYLGLANKAVDYGYRLIIILTSNNEKLRRQTQQRVDEGVLGFDSVKGMNSNPIGIGRHRKTQDVQAYTNTENDFNTSAAKSFNTLYRPSWERSGSTIVVMKKEHTALEAFIKWLGKQDETSIPILIIDDESDYASVNSSKNDDSPTKINKLLRELSSLSPRTSYVAISATPYANIFIDYKIGEDLFPKDFIVLMKTPDAYIGGERLFGDMDHSDEIDNKVVHYLDKDELEGWLPLKHKRTYVLPEPLDKQVKTGIMTFLLSSAIRELRSKRAVDSSMLIHMSRFKQVQKQIAEQADEYLKQVLNSVLFHRLDDDNPDILALHQVYDDQFGSDSYSTDVPWDNILGRIANAEKSGRIVMKLVNSDSATPGDEDEETRIAHPWTVYVGGNILARGMTLSGLICSIFYRDVSAADTLQQMARWFGYRPNYADLERVWLLPDTCKEFQYIVSANNDLYSRVKKMNDADLSPNEFGMMILKDPNNLIAITNQAKRRHAKVSDTNHVTAEINPLLSISGNRVESTILSADDNRIETNREALIELINHLEGLAHTTNGADTIFEKVPGEYVYQFLTEYRAGYNDKYFGNTILPNSRDDSVFELKSSIASQLATTQRAENPDALWNIVFVGKQQKETDTDVSDFNRFFTWNAKVLSAEFDEEHQRYNLSGKSRRLAGSSDVRDLAKALHPELFLSGKSSKGKQGDNELDYYAGTEKYFGDTPVLMLYLLRLHELNTRKKEEQADSAIQKVPKWYSHLHVGAKIVIANSYAERKENTHGDVYYFNTVSTDINYMKWLDATQEQGGDDDD